MTATELQHSGNWASSHVQGWLASLLLHGAVVLAAILLVREIQLAPQEKSFKWNVALISPTARATPNASPPNQTHAQPAPSPRLQQTVPTPRHTLPQPLAQQTTPSITERTVTPVIAKPTEAPVTVPTESAAQTPPPAQTAAIAPGPVTEPTKPDYGWLSEVIVRRVEELKRYPAAARIERADGKVVVKAVINADGGVSEIEVVQSSGFSSLDKAAMETIQQAAPFHLPHPLGRPRLTIKIPISYRLDP